VILIPGVNGDSTKLYALSMHKTCIENHYNLVIVNWRGMAGVPLKSAKTYNGFDTSHIEEAVDYIYNEYCLNEKGKQIKRMSGIGMSLGAGVLAIYQSKMGEQSKLDSSVGICCAFSFKEATSFLKTNFLRLYDMAVGKSFSEYAESYFK
jgi:predicted alpha/beta-fold hydrolase